METKVGREEDKSTELVFAVVKDRVAGAVKETALDVGEEDAGPEALKVVEEGVDDVGDHKLVDAFALPVSLGGAKHVATTEVVAGDPLDAA